MIDRISQRNRPPGFPVLHQRWSRLVFLHWRVKHDNLRPLVPLALELDTFEEEAWVGLTAFTVTRMRPSLLPPVPFLSSAYEINLRTYVHCEGVPGLWFFSLDATNALAVWTARLTYGLPYYLARMHVRDSGSSVWFESQRADARGAPATFEAEWQLGDALAPAPPGSLEFFLTERYVLYATSDARLYRARIHHDPWPLRRAALTGLTSTMLESQGLRGEDDVPLLHAQARPLDVSVWPLERVRGASQMPEETRGA